MAATAPMPSCLPPQLIIAWLPIRDVAAALRVSKDWCAAPEPIFQAIAGRHGLRRVDPSWRETVRRYRTRRLRLTEDRPETRASLALLGSAQANDDEMIRILISRGVNPNFAADSGDTGLHYAAGFGSLDALNALIAAGADLNAQNYGRGTRAGTPLHAAASSWSAPLSRRFACARRLIEAGANARLLNADEDAPYQSKFKCTWNNTVGAGDLDVEEFRKLLKDAFHAQRG